MAIETEQTSINQPEAIINEEKEILNENVGEQSRSKEHFVLVHGIGHGSWCWYKIKTLMENSGAGSYKVTCIDLNGAGINQTDPNTVSEFDDYNKPLLDFLSDLPANEQVILVGHSAGGLSVTDASHKFPEKIKLAVYIAATMLKNGFASDQDVQDGVPDLSEYGEAFNLEFGLGPDHPPTGAVIKQHLLRTINYHLCPQEDSTLASLLVRPGPVQALQKARFNVNGGDEADKVPRIYIKTTNDKALKLDKQEAMVKKWPPSSVFSLDTDHSPFFSAPFLLFGLLIKAIASPRAH